MGRRAELSSGTGWTGDKLGSSVKRCYLKRALGFIQAQERGPGGWDGLALPGAGAGRLSWGGGGPGAQAKEEQKERSRGPRHRELTGAPSTGILRAPGWERRPRALG